MDRRFNKSNFTVDNNRLKIKTNKDVQNTKPTKGPVTAKLLIHPLSSSSSLSSISKQIPPHRNISNQVGPLVGYVGCKNLFGAANSPSENSSKNKTNHTEPQSRMRSSSVDPRAPTNNVTATSRCADSYGSKQMTGSSSYPSSNTTEVSRNQYDLVSSGSGRQSRSDTRSGGSGRRSASLCYMNSVLQCLARVDWRQNVSSDIFVEEFLTLMRDMKAKDRSNVAISPRAFRRQIDSLSQRFRTSEQNDAHEFLLSLLGRLKKGMQRSDKLKGTNAAPNSIIDELFDGEMENTVTFDDCGHPGITSSQPFFTLCLPIPASSNYQPSEREMVYLENCIKSLIKKETMDGDNKLYCIECDPPKLQTGFLNLVLKRLPIVLILCRETRYRLVAVLNHIGSIDFGHYTADVLADKNWYHYSDSSVIEVTDRFRESHVLSREAYILIYEKGD